MAQNNTGRLAVLIDGDNASPRFIAGLLAAIAKHGTASVKRVYGDWSTPQLSGWKACLSEYALQPVQQFAHAPGKNATDVAMIIDAMDLLHSGRFSGFCIVSSDSDFTRLAVRLREQGALVYGFGRANTLSSFVAACTTFTCFDELPGPKAKSETLLPTVPKTKVPVLPAPKSSSSQLTEALVNMLKLAVEALADTTGRAHLGPIGSHLVKQSPGFVSKTYGYKRLSDLVKACDILQVERVGAQQALMVSLKSGSRKAG